MTTDTPSNTDTLSATNTINPHATPPAATVKVWDIMVRTTHWAVALGLAVNLWLTEHGSQVHEWVGYAVVALVAARLLWGFVGSRYARFSDFFPTPARLSRHLAYIKTLKSQGSVDAQIRREHLGHNPMGAMMILLLWAVILGIGLTGYMMEEHLWLSKHLSEQIHEVLANSLYVLVPIHVLSAIVMGKLEKRNLLKSMVTGNKQV